ncbi:AraC-like DNA-binding protein/quercetin dioxygenase-like cupin family protein [Paenibacillus sp. V4I3]|uniref:AraC family transcriptional regulator n=1 Tax=Paenibacillus sp. V4I3 TaxID=3042305 RepID=UPI00278B3208|nr:AraC family transcriptional regulator [Paenibacillus sp. V4I3]MDQ0874723.1 AraC-like DNA-binding protein/quercetin dioxygenase-like cupin family protein [Paenibacillus sp. V4I3]
MNLFKEPIHYNDPLLRIQVRSFNSMEICQHGWHVHPQVEIIAVRSGRMEIHMPAEVCHLRAGDVLILGSCQPHLDLRRQNEVVDYVVLQFEPEAFFDSNMLPYLYLFQEAMLPSVKLNTLFKENSELRQQFYSTVIELQQEHQQRQRGYELAMNYLVKKCIFLLLRHDNMGLLGPSRSINDSNLKSVFDYVEAHLSDKITAQQACHLVNFSYTYFLKYFKQIMGISFTDYVIHRRIKYAERLLLTEDLSIAQIAEQVGLPNISHFYKLFKRLHQCSPKSFKDTMIARTHETTALGPMITTE